MVFLDFERQALGRVHGYGVPGVHPCPLQVLHDTRYQDVLSVQMASTSDFLSHHVFIYEEWDVPVPQQMISMNSVRSLVV